jgi:DNA-directed RNA polymerase subunit RPC12/RpoP
MEVNNMRLIECENCYRGFLPDDEEVIPIIGGGSVAKREDSKGVICPYCGHKQVEENLMTPL